jgi:hypothetical protein
MLKISKLKYLAFFYSLSEQIILPQKLKKV